MSEVNRKTFYASIKSIFPGGYDGRNGKGRISGLDTLCDEWERRTDIEDDEFAYILATTIWETDYTVQPIIEAGGDKYLKSKKYFPWYGRGYVQLTWDYNYKKAGAKIGVDLTANPEAALVPENAAKILFGGMVEGWFTGKKLSDYLGNAVTSDAKLTQAFKDARHIINGSDKATEIAGIALKVYKAIKKAEVANPYPLATSRTAQGASVSGVGGAALLVDNVQSVNDAIQAHQDAFTSGQVIGMVIGSVAILGAVYALYARWDDAGRPKFWQ